MAAVDEADDPREELAVGVLRQCRQVVAGLAGGEGDLVQRLPRRHDGPPGYLFHQTGAAIGYAWVIPRGERGIERYTFSGESKKIWFSLQVSSDVMIACGWRASKS